ncbi:hypothetical protein [Paraglaciecola aestuariivivens]
MYDFLHSQKQQLLQAKVHAELAQKITTRRLTQATHQSKALLASPQGIASAFVLGALNGTNQSSHAFFRVLPELFKLF